MKAFDAISTTLFVTKVIKHTSDWSRINQNNIVLSNAPMRQLSKITEIVTSWESSIELLTKIIGIRQSIFWLKNLKYWLYNSQILIYQFCAFATTK